MQFEEFDKKIKEASEHYHPAYDETAWKKMNQLLDEQLPEKKGDWRRIYYLLFLLIFVTGGGYLLVEKPWNTESKYSINSELNPITQPVSSKVKINTGTNNTNNTTEKKHDQGGGVGSIPGRQSHFIPLSSNSPAGKEILSINKNYKTLDVVADDKNDKAQQKQEGITAENKLAPDINDNSDNKNDVNESTDEVSEAVPSAKLKVRKQKGFINNLGLTISAGPDISAIYFSEPGKTTLYYGAGLRYDISKRVTLRTGFYISNKIYTASGNDYKQSYVYYPNFTLTSVDANCKIFEVPLIVNYNFIQNKKNNVFASIGTSSYFMKREIYHYHYNDQMGQYHYGANTLNNKNKHYFSVLTLGAGYERKLGHILSVSAEPYIKLPLSGIGEGKIKLNSAGLLFSVSIKPFAGKE